MFQVCRLGVLMALLAMFAPASLRGEDAPKSDDAAVHTTVGDSGDAHPKGEAAHKEGGHDEKIPPILSLDVGSAVFNIAIFLGVMAILSIFVWPVILGGLQAREDKIASDLREAQDASNKAQAMLAEYQGRLNEASTQVQSMLAEARRDAEANGQRIVDEAKGEAKRQSERAIADIETAKKVALAELAGQTSSMAMGVAKQVVGRELKADDHADLIRQALDSLPSKN
ncbi:F0F1 ATP synthase subunit B [Stieleria varia]|uniref:ATP synthase subunit b n=1 Tax=Stieleria varia TaxID=2528005 RepID=A0A5C6AXL8_9BACT|nr:F0F1 ATP synthase subunit B [Stieleria varia]TWU04368.1 ATP synthase subunit b, sodium ion specific [Stieleria varia]